MSDFLLGLDPERVEHAASTIRRDLSADAVEVLARTSRARLVTFELDRSGQLDIDSQGSQETGHTIRIAGTDRWGAWSATGAPGTPASTPLTARGQLALPDPARVAELRSDSDDHGPDSRRHALERPLIGESDARRWIDRLVDATREALQSAPADHDPIGSRREVQVAPPFHLRGRLEDGAAGSLLVNTHGVRAPGRSRLTGVRLEVSLGVQSAGVYLAANDDLQAASAKAIRHLVTELELCRRARSFGAGKRISLVLRPRVLAPLVSRVGLRCWRPSDGGAFSAPADSSGVTLWESPEDARGFLGGERDGEGLHTHPALIVDQEGLRPRRPWDRLTDEHSLLGFRWRASWRDLPRFGPSHLQLRTDRPAEDLVAGVEDGIEVVASRRNMIIQEEELLVDALGYRVVRGERAEPVHTTLRLSLAHWLRRLVSCGNDPETHTLSACTVSCPSARLDGVRSEKPGAQ